MRKTVVSLMLICAVASGCAKRANAIAPAAIPMNAYTNLSCAEIATELAKEQASLKSLSKAQGEAATADAVGVFLVGVPIGSVSGGDREGLIAVSKGKVQALEAASTSKGC